MDNRGATKAVLYSLCKDLATRYRHRLHILHLSTGLEVELLRQHKPAWVTAEVTPQHLLLSTADYARLGSLAQMNPPCGIPLTWPNCGRGCRTGSWIALPPTMPLILWKKRLSPIPTPPRVCRE